METILEWFFIFLGGLGAGFIDAVVGGGGLISLPMMLAAGLNPQDSLGTNKIIGSSAAITSSIRYGQSGIIDWHLLKQLIWFPFMFGVLGAYAATLVPPAILRPLIIVGLFLVAVIFMRKDSFGLVQKPAHPRALMILTFLTCAIGFYDGFFGPGTGIFLMFGIVSFAGKTLLQASGNARWFNMASNLGALLFFGLAGYLHVDKAIPGAVGACLGSYLGVKWSMKHQSKGIRNLALVVMIGLFIKLSVDLIRSYMS